MNIINRKDLKFNKSEHVCLIADMFENVKQKNIDFSACVKRLDIGKTTEKHSHNKTDELYYILSGRGILTIDDETTNINQGDFVLIPRNSLHSIYNNGNSQFEFLAIGSTGKLYDGWKAWL